MVTGRYPHANGVWTLSGTPSDESLGIHVPHFLRDGPETRKEMAALQGMVKQLDQGPCCQPFLLHEQTDLAANATVIILQQQKPGPLQGLALGFPAS
jgi:hypothetical protein